MLSDPWNPHTGRLQIICDKRNKLRIRGFSLGIADSIAEKALQSVQIATIPGHFNGVADCPFHPVGHGQKCLDDLACTAFVKIFLQKTHLPALHSVPFIVNNT